MKKSVVRRQSNDAKVATSTSSSSPIASDKQSKQCALFTEVGMQKSAVDESKKEKDTTSPEDTKRFLLSQEDGLMKHALFCRSEEIQESGKHIDDGLQGTVDARQEKTALDIIQPGLMNPALPDPDNEPTPGAVRVGGMTPRDGSQIAFSSDDGLDQSVTEQSTTAPLQAEVVAEVVRQGEGHLIQEFLRFLRGESVVPAEQVVTTTIPSTTSAHYEVLHHTETTSVENEPRPSKSGRRDSTFSSGTSIASQQRVRRLYMVACVTVSLIIIAVVLVAVLVSRRSNASSPTHAPTSSPTTTPISRLDGFRSFLMDAGVSSNEDLSDPSSSQYKALAWLASQDQANLSFSTASNETIVSRYVMAAVYFADGGTHWSQNSSFLSPTPICNWNAPDGYGVFCDPLQIELANNNLTGSILTELGQLSSLQKLDMIGNNLYGTIPTELFALSALTILGFGFNHLQGTILTEIGSLTNLQRLSLSTDGLSGTIPTQLCDLTLLQYLDLGQNVNLKGAFLTEFGRLTNLSWLSFYINSLSGTIPSELGMLTVLTFLAMGANRFFGTIPTEIDRLSSIAFFGFAFNQLSGTLPTQLASLSELTSLSLGTNRLQGTIPEGLGNLSLLQVLDLQSNFLEGTVPTELADIPSLTTLTLHGNNFTGNLTAYFCNHRSWVIFDADCGTGHVECSCCTKCY